VHPAGDRPYRDVAELPGVLAVRVVTDDDDVPGRHDRGRHPRARIPAQRLRGRIAATAATRLIRHGGPAQAATTRSSAPPSGSGPRPAKAATIALASGPSTGGSAIRSASSPASADRLVTTVAQPGSAGSSGST
jgi:hypothetical protein